jgi:hypothetical protein
MRIVQALVIGVACLVLSAEAFGRENSGAETAGDLFVHPFFSHMALADPVGEASFRFTGIQMKLDRDRSEGDFGLHIEAGLLPNLGIHIRNDAVRHEPYSEVMLMYNAWVSEDERFGVSGFGQVSIPTGEDVGDVYKGLFGAGLRCSFPPLVVFNGDIHYDPKDNMAEYEGSFVLRASEMLYPILEARGEITEDATSLYLLPGLKFRIRENQTIGAGFQIAASDEREYDTEALLQYGVEY